jgi:quinol monooxygenase YgiN
MTAAVGESHEVVLVAVFQARSRSVKELTRRLREMTVLTRGEPDCLRYDLHVDEQDPCRLVFIETWASDHALRQHDATDHVQAIHAAVLDLTAAPLIVYRLRPLPAA